MILRVITSMLLAVAMAVAPLAFCAPEALAAGDAGVLDVLAAQRLLAAVLLQRTARDLNGDGATDILDLQRALGGGRATTPQERTPVPAPAAIAVVPVVVLSEGAVPRCELLLTACPERPVRAMSKKRPSTALSRRDRYLFRLAQHAPPRTSPVPA